MRKNMADLKSRRPSLELWDTRCGRAKTALHRTAFTKFFRRMMDTSGSLQKEAFPALTGFSSPFTTRRANRRSPVTIRAASSKIGRKFYGLGHPMAFCDTQAESFAATQQGTACHRRSYYQFSRRVMARCSY